MDYLTRVKEQNAVQADKALSSTRHLESIGHMDNVAQTVLSATSALIQYLERHTSKTEVVNFPTSFSTPDVKFVVEALQVINKTIEKQEAPDLTDITTVMRELLSEAKAIPKEHPEQQQLELINYTSDFKSLSDGLKTLEKAVKAQKLVAEAPVVNVPETKVNVAAPDLKPLTKATDSLEKTVKLGQDEQAQAANKTASGLVTEKFDEYKITYTVPFDDEKPVVSATKYYLSGKLVASIKYSYNKAGDLIGAKKS